MIKETGYRYNNFGGFAFVLEWTDEKAGFLVNLIGQVTSNSFLMPTLINISRSL